MELNNRELASLILLGALLFWVLSYRQTRKSLRGIVASIGQPVLLLPILGLVASVCGLVVLGRKLGLWEPALVPATAAWVLFPGMSLLYRTGTRKEGEPFFRPTVARAFNLTWLIEVFVGFYVFGVLVELSLLIMLIVLGRLSAAAADRERYRPVKQLVDGVLVVIGIGLLLYVAISVVTDWDELDKAFAARAFLLPVGLTLGLLPYLYAVSFWAGYHDAFIWINGEIDDRATRWRAKLGLVLALHFRASKASAFRTYWVRQIVEAESVGAARDVGREFLRDRQRHADDATAAEERLERYAGADGEDEDGQRLDQREFAETKRVLQHLGTMQMGWYRNRGGRYRLDILELLRTDGLPEQHGIKLSVAPDGQSWWAWRRTVTGWCFAIGAAGEPPDEWLYDGPDPPVGFPGQDSAWGERWGIDAKNW